MVGSLMNKADTKSSLWVGIWLSLAALLFMIVVGSSKPGPEHATATGPVQAPAHATKPLNFPPISGTHQIIVFKVSDGDTVHFWWLVPDVARIHGINAPEKHGPTRAAGIAAENYLRNLIAAEPPVAAKFMIAEVRGREKYGRALLRLFTSEEHDLSELMIKAGQAQPYEP